MRWGSLSYKSVSLASKKALITVDIFVPRSKLLQTLPSFNINGVHVNSSNFFIVLRDTRLISGFGIILYLIKNLMNNNDNDDNDIDNSDNTSQLSRLF